MGMGDKPKVYKPSYNKIMCDVTRREFASCLMRKCPEPHVIKHYGENVSLYICRRCKYSQAMQYYGGIACTYHILKEIQQGEQPRTTAK